MALGKWIGGFLGWMTGGPIGALAGIVLGGMFETMFGSDAQKQHNAFDASGRFAQETANLGQRNSFLFSLLVLSSYIIRADGKIMHSEMETVRRMLRQNFGEVAVQQGDVILRRLFDEQNRVGDAQFRQTVNQCCQQMARNMGYAQRLQLLNFLVMIAKADGRVADEEVAAVKEVARWLQVAVSEVESMLGLGGNTLEDAYRVLGLSPSATDSEVKKAYRRLALEHHPDRVASLGDDVRQAAEKKFKEINAAKELIYKTRGL